MMDESRDDPDGSPDWVSAEGTLYWKGTCADCGKYDLVRKYEDRWICQDCRDKREMEL